MVIKRIRSFFNWLLLQEQSPRKLAFSICLGIYIALSPFVGMHTLMKIIFSRLFMLNFTVLFTVSTLINNPWTMVPVYGMGHYFGMLLFGWFNIDALGWDPVWLSSYNAVLQKYIGISGFSLSAFLVGGNVLGIVMSVVMYPIVTYILANCMVKKRPTIQ